MGRLLRTENERDLKKKLEWLTVFRVSLMTLLLGTSLIFQIGIARKVSLLSIPVLILGAIYLLTFCYFVALRFLNRFVVFAVVQLALDILIESVLVLYTGSLESPFTFLYVISIISGSLLLNRKGGVGAASLAFICYGALVDLEFYRWGWFANFAPPDISEKQVYYSFFLYLVVFFTIAMASGALAEKLNRTRKSLEETGRGLEAFKAFHENVVRSMGSGLLTAGLGDEVLSFNTAAEVITGYSYGEVYANKWWKYFGWEESPVVFNPLKESGVSLRFDRESRRKNGQSILVGMTLSPLRDDEGRIKGTVATFQDLTKIRELEGSVKLKERLAHLGEMAAGIAHEIRNPLASLSGSMQILNQELQLSGQQGRLLQIALNETERLNHLVTSFLEYSRPRAPQKSPVRLNSFLEEERLFFNHSVDPEGKFRILLEIDPELTVWIDPSLMRQVFLNLAKNAHEAMPVGGRLTIKGFSVRTGPGAEACHILFEDNGPGIDRSALDKIFNPFFSTKEQGTGLGLAIVHRIVSEHGGQIKVESSPASGTRFEIVFPMEQGNGVSGLTNGRAFFVG